MVRKLSIAGQFGAVLFPKESRCTKLNNLYENDMELYFLESQKEYERNKENFYEKLTDNYFAIIAFVFNDHQVA